jgi:hypothetical protein
LEMLLRYFKQCNIVNNDVDFVNIWIYSFVELVDIFVRDFPIKCSHMSHDI